jgi:hypothetical protein
MAAPPPTKSRRHSSDRAGLISVRVRASLAPLALHVSEGGERETCLALDTKYANVHALCASVYVCTLPYVHIYSKNTETVHMHPQKADSLLKVICGRKYYVTSRVFATGSSTLDDMSEQLAAILNKLEEGRTFFFIIIFFACFISFLHKHKT